MRINGEVNQDKEYKVIKYLSETESEGTWHVIFVAYNQRGQEEQAIFAFLKIGDKFALGDID